MTIFETDNLYDKIIEWATENGMTLCEDVCDGLYEILDDYIEYVNEDDIDEGEDY